ncbi:uncharacterized protein LOC135375344 [Ornithodoros turicata]|uniref:uncharacterized protein LOC135375344 n=1 Tax=Ornithodoros turicata TaxID=34597 RepID=UPI00313968A6
MATNDAPRNLKKLYMYKGRRFSVPRSTKHYRTRRLCDSTLNATNCMTTDSNSPQMTDQPAEPSTDVRGTGNSLPAGRQNCESDVDDSDYGAALQGQRREEMHAGAYCDPNELDVSHAIDDNVFTSTNSLSGMSADDYCLENYTGPMQVTMDTEQQSSGSTGAPGDIGHEGEDSHPEKSETPADEESLPAFEEAELLAGCLREFGDETLPNSPTTKAEAIAMIMSFAVGHSLTWTCIEDLLKLVNLLFGSDVLPRTKYLLRKLWKPKEEKFVRHHYYCEDCRTLLVQDEETPYLACTTCPKTSEISTLRSSGNFFSILNFHQQLKFVISKNKTALYESLRKTNTSDTATGITDVTNAKLCQKLKQDGIITTNDLTFTFNTDGSPVWNSSKTSVWPIQFIVNELPPQLRFKNCVLAGLWFGKSHPNMTLFLTKFVEEVNNTPPVVWQHNSEVLSSRVFGVCCCVDTPARAMVQNHISFNGFFPCTWCLVCGEYIEGSMRFLSDTPDQERTDSFVRRDMALALEVGTTVNGVKGPSPLMNLPYFDLVWGQTVDYMHCVLLGVTRQITESVLNLCTPSTIAAVNSRLESITPPHCFTRLPRSLNERAYWKASEWRHWLLFYSLPCMLGLVPISTWRHFRKLVEATQILLSVELTAVLLRRADGLLRLFVSRTRDLYGNASMTYNMHQLLHLATTAEKLGPLWAHSAFVFEGGNGALVKTVTAAKGAPFQVIERVAMAQELDIVLSSTSLSRSVTDLCHSMLGYEPLKSFEYINGACMLGASKFVCSFSPAESAALQQLYGTAPCSALEFFRFILKGQVYHSFAYTRANKTDSTVLKVSPGNEFFRIQRVLKVTVNNVERCVLLCKEIIIPEATLVRFPLHIKEAVVCPLASLKAVEIDHVIEPVLFINFPSEERSYVCELPNTIERD